MFDMIQRSAGHTTASRFRPRQALATGAGALLTAAALAAPAQAAFPGANGRIAYEQAPSVVLTRTPAAVVHPYWDGSEIWTSDAAGGDAKPLVHSDEQRSAHDPSISPDGTRVAYVESAEVDSRTQQIRVIGLDGSNDHVVVSDDDSFVSAPAWSPDGKQLVYVLPGNGDDDRELRAAGTPGFFDSLWVANVDGSGVPVRIDLAWEGNPDNPQWSPNGKWIAFDDGEHVYVVDATGGTPFRITDNGGSHRFPNWAPDSSAIIYQRQGEGSVIEEVSWEDGEPGAPVEIVDFFGNGSRPAYSPNGLKIVYAGQPWQNQEARGTRALKQSGFERGLMVANVDGSDQKPLLSAEAQLGAPDWGPAARPVAPAPRPPVAKPVVVVSGGGVKGESARRCGSRRYFTIRLRPRGTKIALARVIVNGKRAKVKQGKRWTAKVDLRTLPKKRFKVDITVWSKSGKRFHEVRRYWTCTPARARR
jgi:Tol biopolymer transport system component